MRRLRPGVPADAAMPQAQGNYTTYISLVLHFYKYFINFNFKK